MAVNININNLNYDDEKLNINKKYMPKTNIKNVYSVNETGESAMANEEQLEGLIRHLLHYCRYSMI
jgi:hypothetical protein